MLGTDEERLAYRRAVDKVHAQVRSTESSPVAYNAFDQDLQLWVAACLYRGVEDTAGVFLRGDPKRFYPDSAVLGTTLQVRREQWPADREAFERYWTFALDEVHIDDTMRRYLTDLAELRSLLEHGAFEALLRQRQRRGEAANAAACDQNGACHIHVFLRDEAE